MPCIVPLIDTLFAVTAAVSENICRISQSIEQTVLAVKRCMAGFCDLFRLIALVDPEILTAKAVRTNGLLLFIRETLLADQAEPVVLFIDLMKRPLGTFSCLPAARGKDTASKCV